MQENIGASQQEQKDHQAIPNDKQAAGKFSKIRHGST
jgi:hypothetical protein